MILFAVFCSLVCEVRYVSRKRLCIIFFILQPLCSFLLAVTIYDIAEVPEYSIAQDSVRAYAIVLISLLFSTYIAYRNRNVMKRDYVEQEKRPAIFLCKTLILLVITLLLGELCYYLVDTFFPQVVWENEQYLDLYQSLVPFPLFFANICILGPIAEELVFRYALQGGIKRKPWNVIFASLIFGLLHTGFHPEIIVYAVLGLCYGIAYEKTQDINVPICMHIANNVFSTIF